MIEIPESSGKLVEILPMSSTKVDAGTNIRGNKSIIVNCEVWVLLRACTILEYDLLPTTTNNEVWWVLGAKPLTLHHQRRIDTL